MSGTTDLIIPRVHVQNESNVHDNATLNLNLTGISSFDFIKWTTMSHFTIAKIEGKSKATSDHLFEDFQKLFVKEVIGDQKKLPNGYQYFGDGNCTENLSVFLKTNPFLASALQAHKNAAGDVIFEIKSISANQTNWFHRSLSCLDANSYNFVDATFDSKMKLTGIRTYSPVRPTATLFQWSGSEAITPTVAGDIELACAQLLFLLCYHSQIIHALIHVLHYMLDCAIVGATEHSDDIDCFTNPYIPNVALKYFEVKTLLFSEGGVLTGGLMRSDRDKVMVVVFDMLVVWLRCTTTDDFLNNFLLKDVLVDTISQATLKANDILVQFFLHVDLAAGYADELCQAFEETQAGSLKPTNDELIKFFSDTYDNPETYQISTITSLNAWIQLYSITGIIHGGTLSFSRLLCTPAMVKLYDTRKDKYTAKDTSAIVTVTGTITGMILEHHVYSNKLHSHWLFGHKFKPEVAAVMQKYADKTSEYKEEYLAALNRKPTYFRRFGWIVSDYCPDGVDGKQLTLCTYI